MTLVGDHGVPVRVRMSDELALQESPDGDGLVLLGLAPYPRTPTLQFVGSAERR